MVSQVLILVGTLGGALLGATATIFAQRDASSAARDKLEQEHREGIRAELLRACEQFNRAKQLAQHVADSGDPAARAAAQIELWTRFDQLVLVSDAAVRKSAHALSLSLVGFLWDEGRTESADKVVKQLNLQFEQASHQAMTALSESAAS